MSICLKAQVQREQLAEELNNMKQRFDQHIQGAEVRIQQEREAVRKENKSVEDELNTKVFHQLQTGLKDEFF